MESHYKQSRPVLASDETGKVRARDADPTPDKGSGIKLNFPHRRLPDFHAKVFDINGAGISRLGSCTSYSKPPSVEGIRY